MSNLKRKIVAVVTALSFGLTMASPVFGVTAEELLAQIQQLQQQLNQLIQQYQQLTGKKPTGVPTACTGITFERNLSQGMSGNDVKCLQALLNTDPDTKVAESGPGSPGNETTYFGSLTKAAVIKFQEKYKDEVLTPLGLTAGTGFVGAKTRAKLNAILTAGVPEVPQVPEVTEPTASLAPDNPAAGLVPISAAKVPLLKVKLQAAGEDLTITGMTFKRIGVGAASDWTSLYLYDGEGNRLTTLGRALSSDTHQVEFAGLNIAIPANGSKEIVLRGDVAATGVAGVGNQSAFQLVAIQGATFAGLPVTGNTMTIASLGVSTVNLSSGPSVTNPVVGTKGAEIAKFNLQAGNNDVELKQVVLTISGTVARASVTNIKLYYEDTLLAETATVDSYDNAILTLATGYVIPKTVTKTFTVKADLGGRVGETLTTKIYSTNDVLVIDKVYGYGAVVSGSDSGDSITLRGGTLSLANQGPAAGYILKNTQDVTLLKVGLTATRDVEVRGIQVKLDSANTSSGIFDGDDATKVSDLRLKDAATGATLMTGSIPTNATSATNWLDLTGAFNLTANQTRDVIVTVDVGTDNVLDNVTINADFQLKPRDSDKVEVRDVVTGDYLAAAAVVPATVEGSGQTIIPAGLTLALASHPISSTVIRGSKDVEALGVIFKAAQGGDITLREMGVRVYVRTNSNNFATDTNEVPNPQSVVTAVKLYDGTTLLGSGVLEPNVVSGGPDYGKVIFSNLNLVIPSGQSKTLVVKIDTTKTLTETHYALVNIKGDEVDARKPDGSQVSGLSDINNPVASPSRYVTIETAGTLSATTALDTPTSAIVSIGADGKTGVALLKVELEAEKEAFIITDLVLREKESANPEAFKAIYVEDVPGAFAAGNSTSTFNNLNILVPVGKKTITIKADFLGFGGVIATTSDNVQIVVGGIKAKGVSSEEVQTIGSLTVDTSEIATSSIFALRKSVPTLTASTLPSTSLIAGTRTLYKWTVAADSKGTIDWQRITFTVEGQLNGVAIQASADGSKITNDGGTATTSNFAIINETTGEPVAATYSVSGSGGTVTLSATTTNAQTVAAGQTVTYRLDAQVSGTLATGDTIFTSIKKSANSFVRSTLDAASGSFIWSDKADPDEAWSNDYKVPGIPTATLTLSK